jgi:hypothetical protein
MVQDLVIRASRAALLLIPILLGVAAHAVEETALLPLRVSCTFAGTERPVDPVRLRVVAGPAQSIVSVPPDSDVELLVRPGVVSIEPESERWWSPVQAIHATAPQQTITVPLRAAGELRVRFGGTTPNLESMRMIFETEDVSGSTGCSNRDTHWACRVPAGTVSARLRVPGYVSELFPETVVRPGAAVDLGPVSLRPGASVVGRVDLRGITAAALKEATVGAVRIGGDRARIVAAGRLSAEGSFHLEGIAPGLYELTARAPGFVGTPASVNVVEGRESELVAPLRLDRPAPLRLELVPPVGPGGETWHVRIDRLTDGRDSEVASEQAASAAGLWTWRGVPGRYDVTVRNADGDAVAWTRVVLDPNGTHVTLPVEVDEIEGRVTLGEQPLHAKLFFGPEASYRSVSLVSDQEGRFRGVLPRSSEPWSVTVVSANPSLRRTVEVHPSRHLEIELPHRRIVGTVVDEQGAAIGDAIVNLYPEDADERRIQVQAAAGGIFEAHGLPAGKFRLHADAAHLESELVDVTVGEDEAEKHVDLVVRPINALRGRVTSASGALAGADIHAFPLMPVPSVRGVSSGPDGEFFAPLPHGAEWVDLAVSLPGYAHSMARVPVRPAVLTIRLAQEGGTLIAEIPRWIFDPMPAGRAWVVRGESRLQLPFIGRWGVRKALANDRMEVTIPQMAAGPYRLCILPEPALTHTEPLDERRCASGVLAPFGELRLSVE